MKEKEYVGFLTQKAEDKFYETAEDIENGSNGKILEGIEEILKRMGLEVVMYTSRHDTIVSIERIT